MEHFGILSLLPPVITIILALVTKQTLLSLFFGVWIGSTMVNGYNPLVGFLKIVESYMIPSLGNEYNASLIILVTLAGGFVSMIAMTGAAEAFAKRVTRKINTSKKAQIATWASAFLFSYTEPCLILGTIMRPVTDAVKVSRAKLAYILDSTGCNLAAFSPISSYGPFITGLIATQLMELSISGNEWGYWLRMLPYNLYSLFAILTVFIVAFFNLDVGLMYEEELRARETGILIDPNLEVLVSEEKSIIPDDYELSIMNFVLPMLSLFGVIFATIFYTGDISANGFVGSFRNANITLAISAGFMAGGMMAGLIGISTGLFSFGGAFDGFVKGLMDIIMVPFILIMAWSLGGITGDMGVGSYLTNIVDSYLVGGMVPAIVFTIGAFISFATGSSWGVWAIMMPIAVPMGVAFDIPIPYIVAAVVGGGLFGDQCSPISDTTIMSSTGAACNHILHVTTQLPYGIIVGISSFLGYLFGGLTGKYELSIGVTAVILIILLILLNKIEVNRVKKETEIIHD